MSNTIHNASNFATNLPYATDADATGDAGGTDGAAQALTSAPGQAEATTLQSLLLPYVANALGVNAYGNVGVGPNNVGIGQVMMPPSTQVAASARALQNVQALMGSYGQGGAAGADGVVGTSLIAAAENGELPDLSGYTGGGTAQPRGTPSGSSTPASSSNTVTLTNPMRNIDTSQASSQLIAASTANMTSSAPSISNRLPLISSLATDSATSSFSSTVIANADNNNDKACGHKLQKGEEANASLIQSLGIEDISTANRIAQMLNSDNQEVGTSGTPKQNIINLMAVLNKLQDSGQGTSKAADQAREQLRDVVGVADTKGQGTLSTDFIAATNVASSFVTQFALNPSLTQFTEPTITSSTASTRPWPDIT